MVGILLIATRKYKQFVSPLVEQIGKYFLPGTQKTIYLFTDGGTFPSNIKLPVLNYSIEPLSFPYATLYRYKLFTQQASDLSDCSHLFYLDVDMAIIENVGSEILGDGLTVVRHPGFFALPGWGSHNVHPESKAFIPPEGWLKYFAGGFNGGRSDIFLKMAKELAANIQEDESKGIIAEHNDESHLNHYLWAHPEIERIELSPSYCMPEEQEYKQNWGLSHLPSIILALAKDHKSIRE